MLSGGNVPLCYVNTGPNGTWAVCEMVDGKQRVTACIEWLDGNIPAVIDGVEIKWADLDRVSKTRCSTEIGLRMSMLQTDRKGALKTYIKLNASGVPHSEEEIDRVKTLLSQETE
jgi:hypothetical protein